MACHPLIVGAMDHNGYMDESWRPVVGLEGVYEISSHGRVRSLDRLVGGESRGRRMMRGRVRRLNQMKNGYMTTSLGGTTHLVHRLVLEAFVGPAPIGTECCHNDNDRTNNRVENLRWDTRYENCQDTRAAGTHWQTRKTHCPKGHPYDGELRTATRVMRVCKQCRNEKERARYAARKVSTT